MKAQVYAASAVTLIVAASLAQAGQGSPEVSPKGPKEVPLNQAMDNPSWQNLTGESPEPQATQSPLPKKKKKTKKNT